MQQEITPVIIIGSARNGTTNLENLVAALPQVAGVEHWLHHGSQESNIYMNHKYWGDLSDVNHYIDFLYHYTSSDYFQLCKGEPAYHLQHPRTNFYSFFLDLMDHYAQNKNKRYWVTKLDSCFFYDDKERASFIDLLHKRYPTVKYISIQRNFTDAFNSYRNMEGKKHTLRQKPISLIPALVYQASRYALIYGKLNSFSSKNILHLTFETYIKNRQRCLKEIADFLHIPLENPKKIDINRFQPNTSFSSQPKKELTPGIRRLIPLVLKFLQLFPFIAQLIWKTYYRTKASSPPIFRRLLKFKYFREELIAELSEEHAKDLVEQIKEKGVE